MILVITNYRTTKNTCQIASDEVPFAKGTSTIIIYSNFKYSNKDGL